MSSRACQTHSRSRPPRPEPRHVRVFVRIVDGVRQSMTPNLPYRFTIRSCPRTRAAAPDRVSRSPGLYVGRRDHRGSDHERHRRHARLDPGDARRGPPRSRQLAAPRWHEALADQGDALPAGRDRPSAGFWCRAHSGLCCMRVLATAGDPERPKICGSTRCAQPRV